MKKTNKTNKLTITDVQNRAVRKFKTPHGKTCCYVNFLADGHLVEDTSVVWYQEGDGIRYGFSSDRRLVESLCHHGFKPVKIV